MPGWAAMLRTRTLVGALCAAGTAIRLGFAQAETPDPFREAEVVDAIGLARLADEAGDAALLRALRDPSSREHALIAARAAPNAHAPELLVPALVPLACGRDPVLAPEAAMAISAISARLLPSEVAAREVLLSDLRTMSVAVSSALKELKSPRPDILFALTEAASAFAGLETQLSGK